MSMQYHRILINLKYTDGHLIKPSVLRIVVLVFKFFRQQSRHANKDECIILKIYNTRNHTLPCTVQTSFLVYFEEYYVAYNL